MYDVCRKLLVHFVEPWHIRIGGRPSVPRGMSVVPEDPDQSATDMH